MRTLVEGKREEHVPINYKNCTHGVFLVFQNNPHGVRVLGNLWYFRFVGFVINRCGRELV